MELAVAPSRPLNELPTDLAESFKEAFDLFDRENNGTIALNDLSTVLRCLGQHPTEEEVSWFMEQAKAMQNQTHVEDRRRVFVTFDTFRKLTWDTLRAQDTSDELLAAFDRVNVEIDERMKQKAAQGIATNYDLELRKVLTEEGEPITNDEVDEMFRVGDLDASGNFDYKLYTDLVFAYAPRLKK